MSNEDSDRLSCERIVNESLSKADRLLQEIIQAIEEKNPSERDISLLRIGASAFAQRAMLENAEGVALFNVDLLKKSKCGERSEEECPCERDICLLYQ